MNHMNQSPLRDRRVLTRLKLYNRYDAFKVDCYICLLAFASLVILVWGY